MERIIGIMIRFLEQYKVSKITVSTLNHHPISFQKHCNSHLGNLTKTRLFMRNRNGLPLAVQFVNRFCAQKNWVSLFRKFAIFHMAQEF